MKISKKMETQMGQQVNAELYSAYIYLSMAGHFEGSNLPGFANWMKVQAKEELGHAMKLFGYVFARGGSVQLSKIDKPPAAWKSPLAVFEDAYRHEQHVTGLIDRLFSAARADKDTATEVFLQWFITEQVEEEASALAIVEKLKMVKESKQGLLMLDRELGKRGE